MKRRARIVVVSLAALILLTFCLLLFVPVAEYQTTYCFHCGQVRSRTWVCGVPVSSRQGALYDDNIEVPIHEHHLIEMCGGRMWMLRSMENWDEFGWTGTGFRSHLRRAIAAYPGKHAEIIMDYLAVSPRDDEAQAHFVEEYRTGEALAPAADE